MKLSRVAPKTFIGLPIGLGALIVGIIMTVIMILCIIATAIQLVNLSGKTCVDCPEYSSRNAYSYSIAAVIYSVFMLICCLWFIWGVHKEKASVVLGWLVINTMWLAQTFCILIVLICLYSEEAAFFAWLLALIFGLVAVGLLVYGLLVVLGFWIQLKLKAGQENA